MYDKACQPLDILQDLRICVCMGNDCVCSE